MESLTTASDILSQLKQLTEGMASIRRDVDMLKRESLLHRVTTDEFTGNEDMDETADNSALRSDQPPAKRSSAATSLEPTTCIKGTTWAEKMDTRDPILDDDDLSSAVAPAAINVVPVTDRTNQFLKGCLLTR